MTHRRRPRTRAKGTSSATQARERRPASVRAPVRVRDALKGFTDGAVSKAIAPEQTFEIALDKIQRAPPPILDRYLEVERPSGIPQFMFVGATPYRETCGALWALVANGKGHTAAQALASGIMEMVERFSCCKYCSFGNGNLVARASLQHLDDSLVDPERLFTMLPSGKRPRRRQMDVVRSAAMAFYPAQTLDGGRTDLPLTFLRSIHGTNGMAAGSCLEEALLHGICEVVERHCSTLIDSQRLQAPTIDASSIDSPLAQELLRRFELLGTDVLIKDLSLGLGLPVIGVLRKLKKGRCLVTTGVATSPDEALVRALTESSQGEGPPNVRTLRSAEHLLLPDSTVELRDVPSLEHENMRVELQAIDSALRARGMRAFFFDTTEPRLKIPSVIVYIAGATAPEYWCGSFVIAAFRESMDAEDYDHAMECVKVGRRAEPQFLPYYLLYEAQILRRRGCYGRALRPLREGLALAGRGRAKGGQGNVGAACAANLALCYQALNQNDDAVEATRALIEERPRFSFDWFAEHADTSSQRDREVVERAKALHEGLLRSTRSGMSRVRVIGLADRAQVSKRETASILGQLRMRS